MFSPQRCALLEYAPSFEEAENAPSAPIGGAPQEPGCCEAHSLPGCTDTATQTCVCKQDPFCCDQGWDQACANLARDVCGGCVAPSAPPSRPLATSVKPRRFSPRNVRDAFIAKLSADDQVSAAGLELLADLEIRGQQEIHRERLARFIAACEDRATLRDPEGFVMDLLAMSHARLAVARDFAPLLDTPGATPTSALAAEAGTRFNLYTCELEVVED